MGLLQTCTSMARGFLPHNSLAQIWRPPVSIKALEYLTAVVPKHWSMFERMENELSQLQTSQGTCPSQAHSILHVIQLWRAADSAWIRV